VWQRSFVSMSVLLGIPATEAVRILQDASKMSGAECSDLESERWVAELSDPRRPVRAKALALAVHEIVADLGEACAR